MVQLLTILLAHDRLRSRRTGFQAASFRILTLTGENMTDIVGLSVSGEKFPFVLLASENRKPWERSLPDFLDLAVRRNPDKIFVEISERKITYQQFQRRVIEVAALFRSLGVDYGDRACLFLPNCPEFLYCWFGLSTIGAICVPINTAYKRDETAYILNDAEACALVADE